MILFVLYAGLVIFVSLIVGLAVFAVFVFLCVLLFTGTVTGVTALATGGATSAALHKGTSGWSPGDRQALENGIRITSAIAGIIAAICVNVWMFTDGPLASDAPPPVVDCSTAADPASCEEWGVFGVDGHPSASACQMVVHVQHCLDTITLPAIPEYQGPDPSQCDAKPFVLRATHYRMYEWCEQNVWLR